MPLLFNPHPPPSVERLISFQVKCTMSNLWALNPVQIPVSYLTEAYKPGANDL